MFHLIVFFIYMFIYLCFCLNLFKVILPLYFCIALWDIYYVHLVWEDIENDLNRIMDSFQIFFLNFYKCFGHAFSMEATNSVDEAKGKKSLILSCAIYHKCIMMIMIWN